MGPKHGFSMPGLSDVQKQVEKTAFVVSPDRTSGLHSVHGGLDLRLASVDPRGPQQQARGRRKHQMKQQLQGRPTRIPAGGAQAVWGQGPASAN